MLFIHQTVTLLKENRDAKTLVSNFVSLSVLKLIGYIFPLITLPYLSRVIGAAGFGELAFAASVIVFVETLTNFGFNYTATRDLARCKEDIDQASHIFCNVFYAKAFLMIVGASLLAVCMYTIPLLHEYQLLLWLTFLYIPGYIIFPEWFFQAEEKMGYITVMNFISKLIFTLLVFIVIKEPQDYIYQPILVACGFFLSGIISLVFVFRKFKIKVIAPHVPSIVSMIQHSWRMFMSLILPNLYTNFSTILLRSYGGSVATGIYSNGYRFIELTDQLSQVLSRTFYPYLARRMDKHHLYVLISGSISILACLFLFCSADLLVKIFYTPEFNASTNVIRIMSIAPFALFLMNTYGPNYLVLKGQEKLYSRIVLVYSIIGFILTWYLTVEYSFIGMAITITTIWILRGITIYIYAKRNH